MTKKEKRLLLYGVVGVAVLMFLPRLLGQGGSTGPGGGQGTQGGGTQGTQGQLTGPQFGPQGVQQGG